MASFGVLKPRPMLLCQRSNCEGKGGVASVSAREDPMHSDGAARQVRQAGPRSSLSQSAPPSPPFPTPSPSTHQHHPPTTTCSRAPHTHEPPPPTPQPDRVAVRRGAGSTKGRGTHTQLRARQHTETGQRRQRAPQIPAPHITHLALLGGLERLRRTAPNADGLLLLVRVLSLIRHRDASQAAKQPKEPCERASERRSPERAESDSTAGRPVAGTPDGSPPEVTGERPV